LAGPNSVISSETTSGGEAGACLRAFCCGTFFLWLLSIVLLATKFESPVGEGGQRDLFSGNEDEIALTLLDIVEPLQYPLSVLQKARRHALASPLLVNGAGYWEMPLLKSADQHPAPLQKLPTSKQLTLPAAPASAPPLSSASIALSSLSLNLPYIKQRHLKEFQGVLREDDSASLVWRLRVGGGCTVRSPGRDGLILPPSSPWERRPFGRRPLHHFKSNFAIVIFFLIWECLLIVIQTGKLQPVLIWREKPVLLALLRNLTIPVPASYPDFRTKWREIS